MDDSWINQVNNAVVTLVPTRSLATSLQLKYSDHQAASGNLVWETPNIMVWGDYLDLLWQLNSHVLAPGTTLISASQSILLWSKVIELSRRQERELTLLNVNQTCKAVERSWRLVHDWNIPIARLAEDHVADSSKFIEWANAYSDLLVKKNLIDRPTLQTLIAKGDKLNYPFQTVIWHSFDLITDSQKNLQELEGRFGVQHVDFAIERASEQFIEYRRFDNSREEIAAAFEHARREVSNNQDIRLNIVVPDLQQRYEEIKEIAREIFYPSHTPLQVHLDVTAFRFSLGQPLAQWAPIEAALSLLQLLSNSVSIKDLSLVLRNRYITVFAKYGEETLGFQRWMEKRRYRRVLLDDVPSLIREYLSDNSTASNKPEAAGFYDGFLKLVELRQEFDHRLKQQQELGNFASLTFNEWTEVFQQWLTAWKWDISAGERPLNSVDFQLRERWEGFIIDFAKMTIVQRRIGLKKVLELINSHAREAIFLPKSSNTPIMISGIYEAIGQNADHIWLCGMHQKYPANIKADAFVPSRLLTHTGYPDVSPSRSIAQHNKVIGSLTSGAKHLFVSHAIADREDHDVKLNQSVIFRRQKFLDFSSTKSPRQAVDVPSVLIGYVDTQGSQLTAATQVSGGTTIFENQSVCAFKSFVTHRLKYERELENEFGLDHLDRGVVVHRLLELAWGELQSQSQLKSMDLPAMQQFTHRVLERLITDPMLRLNEEKQKLLLHEKPRLIQLLQEWLEHEVKRLGDFVVLEREQEYETSIGDIHLKFVIDRLDALDDGRTVLIDYKTGNTSRNEWQGDRLSKPQLPLYVIALEKVKTKPVSGIAYAKVETLNMEFQELAETDIFRADNNRYAQRYAEQWQSSKAQWPGQLEKLAADFLQGDAQVNPLDEKSCRFCKLQSICRVSQLRKQTNNRKMDSMQEGLAND